MDLYICGAEHVLYLTYKHQNILPIKSYEHTLVACMCVCVVRDAKGLDVVLSVNES